MIPARTGNEGVIMVSKIHRNNMVWIDMEMTGLDPKRRIIEIATIITDGNSIFSKAPIL